jgi:hypothetical protein
LRLKHAWCADVRDIGYHGFHCHHDVISPSNLERIDLALAVLIFAKSTLEIL